MQLGDEAGSICRQMKNGAFVFRPARVPFHHLAVELYAFQLALVEKLPEFVLPHQR